MTNREKGQAGLANRINRRRTLGRKGAGSEREERKIPGASHPAKQQVTEKELKEIKYTEIEEDKSPEAKGRWNNLRKAG